MNRGVRTALLAVVMAAIPGVAAAQFSPPSQSAAPFAPRWPDPPKVQTNQAPPQAEPQPKPQPASRKPAPQAQPSRDAHVGQIPAEKPNPKPAAAAPVIACSGVFGKDSTHLKLAAKFDPHNIVFGKVDGPGGSKINASILYPNDPKRRLEVLWSNEDRRSDTSVIAINGQSHWIAPKGLKLGLAIAALEKANGKPFKLSGFGADGFASVVGWEDGALSTLPGGCKVGIRLMADRKAPDEARKAAAGDKELLSNDAGVRALKPTIAEILVGY